MFYNYLFNYTIKKTLLTFPKSPLYYSGSKYITNIP